jgi:microcystin-dependent protein
MDNGNSVPDKDNATLLINGGGGPANRVTSTTADRVGDGAGQEEISVLINNLPEHTHDMLSDSGKQYFAAGSATGTADSGTQAGAGLSVGATGYGLPNSGGVQTTRLGDSINVMNPYLTINYIIFTGAL